MRFAFSDLMYNYLEPAIYRRIYFYFQMIVYFLFSQGLIEYDYEGLVLNQIVILYRIRPNCFAHEVMKVSW